MAEPTEWDPRTRAAEARRRAERALPRPVDLWGLSWERDDDRVDVGSAVGASDACLPATFPEAAKVADADVTYVRARRFGLVHAVSMVFDDALSAHQAWLQLGDPTFVSCFAESVVAAVDLDDGIELLGPAVRRVVPVAPGATAGTGGGPSSAATSNHPSASAGAGRSGGRTTRSHVALSAATDDALHPIGLDVAVILAGPLVVMLWAVERPGPAKDRGWSRLVERVERKAVVAAAP